MVSVGVLQITGGADFAENFDVNVGTTTNETMRKVEPGLVVSIDAAHPGKLALSTQAYDRRVAGIISGAGGVKPGMMMSQEGTLATGQHPVALNCRNFAYFYIAHLPALTDFVVEGSDPPATAHMRGSGWVRLSAWCSLR